MRGGSGQAETSGGRPAWLVPVCLSPVLTLFFSVGSHGSDPLLEFWARPSVGLCAPSLLPALPGNHILKRHYASKVKDYGDINLHIVT